MQVILEMQKPMMGVDIYSVDKGKFMFRNTSNISLYFAPFLLVSIIIILKELKLLHNWKLLHFFVSCFDSRYMKIIADVWLLLVRGNWMGSNMNNFFFVIGLLVLWRTELKKSVSLKPKSRWLAIFSKSIYLVAVDSSRSPVHFSPFPPPPPLSKKGSWCASVGGKHIGIFIKQV